MPDKTGAELWAERRNANKPPAKKAPSKKKPSTKKVDK